jgi:hypothetical protein
MLVVAAVELMDQLQLLAELVVAVLVHTASVLQSQVLQVQQTEVVEEEAAEQVVLVVLAVLEL